MPILAWCLKNWRIFAYAAAAIAFAWMVLLVRHWHADSLELPHVKDALAAEQQCAVGSECNKRVQAFKARQVQVQSEVVARYETEIAALNARPVTRRVIRVCPDPSDVRDAASPAGTPEATPGGVVPRSDELDTRPLRDLASRADALNAAYRALYDRDTALATPAK